MFARASIGLGLALSTTTIFFARPIAAQLVPTDAQLACAISQPALAAMFESGTITPNGVVKPANSLVNLTPNCGFFSWSEQMFLWLTSPAPSSYGGGGGRIMFSPSFYTVSPPFNANQSEMRRNFIPNTPGIPLRMGLRATELGPHLLPATLSKTGQVVEVERPDPRKPVPAVIRLQNGALARLSDVKRAPSGALQFFSAGKPVVARKLALPKVQRLMVKMPNGTRATVIPQSALSKAIIARKIIFKGIPILIDANNTVIDVEAGQAGGGGVLISQNNALIYYITTVNDVFAYHRTMQGPAIIPSNTNLAFPTTAAGVGAVVNFAAAHGRTIVDPEALAIETKSSWVEASAVPNPGDYIQVQATIPTFDKSNPNLWVPNGQKTVTLVMVGLHVVGSTLGHGEMVWGSFEHVSNAPNATYQYQSTTGTKTVPQNTSGSWLFTPNGSAGPFNATTASWDDTTGNIAANAAGTPISSTPVLRMHPWGSPGNNTSLNTQVISSTASVIAQLAPGDVRRRYFQLGTTWTIGGQAPNGANEVGTNLLANATMETFMQASSTPPANSGTNCFSCHGTNKVAVSHVYRVLNPLF